MVIFSQKRSSAFHSAQILESKAASTTGLLGCYNGIHSAWRVSYSLHRRVCSRSLAYTLPDSSSLRYTIPDIVGMPPIVNSTKLPPRRLWVHSSTSIALLYLSNLLVIRRSRSRPSSASINKWRTTYIKCMKGQGFELCITNHTN